MITAPEVRREDSVLRVFIVIALLLEIIVFIEPAPVDALLMLCLGVALVLGKLHFPTVGALPIVSLAVFGMANLVSMYDPLDPQHALFYLLVTFYLVASWFFFVGIAGHYGKPMVGTMINAYCVAGFISALIGVGGYFHVLPFLDQLLLNGRARGLFKDCNVYGPFFVPVILFALTRIMDARSTLREKTTPIVFLVPCLVAVLLCFSRACWVNFLVATAFFLVGQVAFPGLRNQLTPRDIRRRIRVGASVVVLGVFALALLNTLPGINKMLAQRVTSNGLQDYDRVRFATQNLALDSARTHPLGIGPGQVELVFDYATHSMYVRILSENGIIALIAILVFILGTAGRCVSVIERAEDPWYREVNLVVLACIIGHLANSFVIDTVHWRHIWFLYALPWAPARLRMYAVSVASRVTSPRLNNRPSFLTPGFPAR